MVHWVTRSMAEMCGAGVGLYQRVPQSGVSRYQVKVLLAPQSALARTDSRAVLYRKS